MRVPIVLILGLLAIYAIDGSVIPDQALTANLQDAWYEDKFVIALSNYIRDKKKHSGSSFETLLSVKYRGTKTKMVLLLDRRTKRVILESFDDTGRRSASHVTVDSLAVNTPLKSLIILVHQKQPNSRMDVYVDCVYEGSIPLKKTFRNIAETENSFVEVFRERRCQIKVYQSVTITEVLRKEQCPDNLNDMKQPSVFETFQTKAPIDSNEDDQKKSTDRLDGIDSRDEINGRGSSTPDHNSLTSFTPKHPWDHKKPSDKKDHHGRPKKSDHSGHPDNKDKPDKHDPYDPSNLFPQPEEMDDLNYPDGSQPLFTSQSPKGHRPKKPHQSGSTKRPGSHLNLGPAKSGDPDKPERSDESDGLDYPNGPYPSQVTWQPPHFTAAYRPTKKPEVAKPNQSDSRPGSDKRHDGSNPYDSNKNPSLTPGSGSPNSSKRPGRSPYSGSSGQDGYDSNQTDTPDSSDESSSKRVPRRGDIGIQSLDERVCQTDDQIVKTLNELINATKKLWRELELNRMETQHLRHLIENCSACRPIGE